MDAAPASRPAAHRRRADGSQRSTRACDRGRRGRRVVVGATRRSYRTLEQLLAKEVRDSGECAMRPHVDWHGDETRPALHTQDTEQGGDTPDVDRPPDQDVPDFGKDLPDSVRDPGAPPFTGEDVEDTGKPGWRKSPQDEPMGPHATCA